MEIFKTDKTNLKYSFIKIAINSEFISELFFFRLKELNPEWADLIDKKDKKELQNEFILTLKDFIFAAFNEHETWHLIQNRFATMNNENLSEMIPMYGSALLWAFKRVMAQQFSDELQDSWKSVIDFTTQTVIRKQNQRVRKLAI